MFRMWCKLFTDNHLVKDITIEDSSDVNRTSKVFMPLRVHVTLLTCPFLSGSIRPLKNSNATIRQNLIRTILLNTLILISWKFRLLRRIEKYYNPLNRLKLSIIISISLFLASTLPHAMCGVITILSLF